MRFDEKSRRRDRLRMDKFCHVSEIWNAFIENCQRCYIPDLNLTIDYSSFSHAKAGAHLLNSWPQSLTNMASSSSWPDKRIMRFASLPSWCWWYVSWAAICKWLSTAKSTTMSAAGMQKQIILHLHAVQKSVLWPAYRHKKAVCLVRWLQTTGLDLLLSLCLATCINQIQFKFQINRLILLSLIDWNAI